MNGVLNNNIKFFRIYKGITQGELAEKIGKTKNVISNWERGDNSPDIDSVEKICVALSVTQNQAGNTVSVRVRPPADDP